MIVFLFGLMLFCCLVVSFGGDYLCLFRDGLLVVFGCGC